ncbi:MAG: cupin domain-containing protein [Gemmatimonadales bacterium]
MPEARWIIPGTALCGALLASGRSEQRSVTPPRGEGPAHTVASQALSPLDGDHLKVTLVEVTYAPAEGSPAHRHPCAVVGYVIEGTLRTQVSGEREAVYAAGESFYEAPNSAHLVSANASKKVPVRFLAWFTCDQEGSLSVPVEAGQAPGGHRP